MAASIVNNNIIWGTKVTKNIFGFRGIAGVLNLDISLELCTGLGSAFSTSLGKNSTLVIGSDSRAQSFIVQSSLATGILSVGGQAILLDNSIMPMTRYGVVYHRANGGIHVYTSHENPCKTYIEFFDEKGINISRSQERKIENLMNQDDYDRCKAEDIKGIIRMENFHEVFVRQGLEQIAYLDEIRRKNFKLALASYSDGSASIAYKFLESLGCGISLVWSGFDNLTDSTLYKHMSNYIIRRKADLGVIIKGNGENLILIDERGRVVKDEEYLLLAELIAIKGYDEKNLVFPYAFPRVAEEIAKINGAKIFRVSSSPAEIMKKMVELGSDIKRPLIQFILNHNGIWALGYILEFMAINNTKISKLIDSIPEYYYMKKEINCDWKDKGRIIREIAFGERMKDIELIEGVKIKDSRGWALVLPDNEKPVFNIYAEGYSQEMAQELSADLSEKIAVLLKNQRQ